MYMYMYVLLYYKTIIEFTSKNFMLFFVNISAVLVVE